jgi:ribosomal protein S8
MLLNTFDFIEKPVRLTCYEKHCYLYWKKKWESIPYSTIQSRSYLRNVKALKQTKRQYQVHIVLWYTRTRCSQYLSIWICSHTNSCTVCGGTMGAIIVPLWVLILNNKYINVSKSKAQWKLVSG